jgi:hypothetical protein
MVGLEVLIAIQSQGTERIDLARYMGCLASRFREGVTQRSMKIKGFGLEVGPVPARQNTSCLGHSSKKASKDCRASAM